MANQNFIKRSDNPVTKKVEARFVQLSSIMSEVDTAKRTKFLGSDHISMVMVKKSRFERENSITPVW